jgi:phage terminase small subunit
MSLTPKRATFVREYLVDLNGTQAAIRAGYSSRTAEKIASELVRVPEVAKAIQAGMDARAARVQVNADDILRELLRIARVDIGQAFTEDMKLRPLHEIPEDVRRAIAGVEIDETFEGSGDNREWTGYTKKVKFWDKPRALELLGKHLKLFTEKVEHSGDVRIEIVRNVGARKG